MGFPYEHPPRGWETEPWWIPGWTAQRPLDRDQVPPDRPRFPEHIDQVRLGATYLWGSEAEVYRASVLVRAAAPLVDTVTGTRVLPHTTRIPIRGGQLALTLPASTGPTLAAPFSYSVWEVMPGGRRFMIRVPAGVGETVQQLHALEVDEPYQPIPVPRLTSRNYNWIYQ
ncbi:hypothetical protein [Streptomyces rimosus]|uniref:hypothetical protein n=1 Tax=Streptomyces rimosus TaxID=1927 RepID=UPI0004CACD45|nr:hypothetical protein [Streptomyces rimosus]